MMNWDFMALSKQKKQEQPQYLVVLKQLIGSPIDKSRKEIWLFYIQNPELIQNEKIRMEPLPTFSIGVCLVRVGIVPTIV